jgi:hypothetical protein
VRRRGDDEFLDATRPFGWRLRVDFVIVRLGLPFVLPFICGGYSFGEKSREIVFFEPSVVFLQQLSSVLILVTADLKFESVGEVALGRNMSQQVRNIAEPRMPGADGAVQIAGVHWPNLGGLEDPIQHADASETKSEIKMSSPN